MITYDSKGHVQLGPIEFVIQAMIGGQESGVRGQVSVKVGHLRVSQNGPPCLGKP